MSQVIINYLIICIFQTVDFLNNEYLMEALLIEFGARLSCITNTGTIDSIRRELHIANDYTTEESERIDEQNEWLENTIVV